MVAAVESVVLDESDLKAYGALSNANRCPRGFRKVSVLGKGGCAIVWLCQSIDDPKIQVAAKQFPKSSVFIDSGRDELRQNLQMFDANGDPVVRDHRGSQHICQLVGHQEDKMDLWLLFTACPGRPLSKLLCQTQGGFVHGERIYDAIQNEETYGVLQARNCRQLKLIIKMLLEALDFIHECGVVHCDFKPENIIVDLDAATQTVSSLKVIDFGSSFDFQDINLKLDITTPEYLPPEVLEHNQDLKSNMGNLRNLLEYVSPWSIDIWSLGIILLECVLSYPIWMAYKGRIIRPCSAKTERVESAIVTGLLGVTGRVPKKIIKLQQQHLLGQNSIANLMARQQTALCLGSLNKDSGFQSFIQSALEGNPKQRTAPHDLLSHAFIGDVAR